MLLYWVQHMKNSIDTTGRTPTWEGTKMANPPVKQAARTGAASEAWLRGAAQVTVTPP